MRQTFLKDPLNSKFSQSTSHLSRQHSHIRNKSSSNEKEFSFAPINFEYLTHTNLKSRQVQPISERENWLTSGNINERGASDREGSVRLTDGGSTTKNVMFQEYGKQGKKKPLQKQSNNRMPPLKKKFSKDGVQQTVLFYRDVSAGDERTQSKIEYSKNTTILSKCQLGQKKMSVDQFNNKIKNKVKSQLNMQSAYNSRKNSINMQQNNFLKEVNQTRNSGSKLKKQTSKSRDTQRCTPKKSNKHTKPNSSQKKHLNEDLNINFTSPPHVNKTQIQIQKVAKEQLKQQLIMQVTRNNIQQRNQIRVTQKNTKQNSPGSSYRQQQSESVSQNLNLSTSRSHLKDKSPHRQSDDILLEQYQSKLKFPMKYTEKVEKEKEPDFNVYYQSTSEAPQPEQDAPRPSRLDNYQDEGFLSTQELKCDNYNEYFKTSDQMTCETQPSQPTKQTKSDQNLRVQMNQKNPSSNSLIFSNNTKDQIQSSFLSSQFQDQNSISIQNPPKFPKTFFKPRSKISQLKLQIQQNVMKGNFDLKFIRQLETESAIFIQRCFRQYRIKKIRPIVDGFNACTQTDSLSQQEIAQKYKAQLYYAYILISMMKAVQKKKQVRQQNISPSDCSFVVMRNSQSEEKISDFALSQSEKKRQQQRQRCQDAPLQMSGNQKWLNEKFNLFQQQQQMNQPQSQNFVNKHFQNPQYK